MIQFLRLVGIFNGAVWLGSAVFFTLSIGPAVFSPQMLANFGGAEHPLSRLYAGLVAQVLISGYFKTGLWCAAVAILHMVAEWLYTGRTPRAWRVYLLLFLLAGGLAGKLYMQPNMETLHRTKYSQTATPEGRETAAASFKKWHAVSQSLNLLMLLGMGVHLWGVASSGEAVRFTPLKHFRS